MRDRLPLFALASGTSHRERAARATALALASLGAILTLAHCGSDDGPGSGPGGGGDPTADAGATPPDGVGLVERPANPTCKAPPRPRAFSGGDIAFAPAFPNMDFDGYAITILRSRAGASGPLRWFVVQRNGEIWTFVDANASKDGKAADGVTDVETAELFLDLPTPVAPSGEGGLLGAALDPEFGLRDDASYVYAHYTTSGSPARNHIERFRVARQANAWTIAESKKVFMTESGGSNHWGGDVKFGPDNFLYVSLGDGGSGYDVGEVQRLAWLRGRILRLDPRGSLPAGCDGDCYAIPETNAFRLTDPENAASAPRARCGALSASQLQARAAGDACPETFAWGFRNPFRMTFDKETGRLWVADVGTGKEEVNVVVSGRNYGWPICDGISPQGTCPPKAEGTSYVAPVAQYREGSYVSVIGGYVYRGAALGERWFGRYLFTNVSNSSTAEPPGDFYFLEEPYAHVTFAPSFSVNDTFEHPAKAAALSLPAFGVTTRPDGSLVAFAEDEHNELYAIYFASGKGNAVFKLVPADDAAPPQDPIPELLSQTGCFDPADPKKVAPGVIPYELNAPFWSDGADKERFLAIPDGRTIRIDERGHWELPNESVLVKSFRLGGKLVETRLLVRHTDGEWAGYTYVWNDAQTDAVKASPFGETHLYGDQRWRFPSRSACLECHTTSAGRTLGLETRQLNREAAYGDRRANQIDTLAHIGMFDAPPPEARTLPAFVDPLGAAPLEERARVYLHTNCAQCHNGQAQRPNLRFEASLADTKLCDAPALLAPGDPAASRIVRQLRDPDPSTRMPRGGGFVIDEAGVGLVESWIASKTSCP